MAADQTPNPFFRLEAVLKGRTDLLPDQQNLLDDLLSVVDTVLDRLEGSPEDQQELRDETASLLLADEMARQGYTDVTPSGLGLLVTDAEGIIRRANRRAGGLLHRRPDLLVGQAVADLAQDENRATLRRLLEQAHDPENLVQDTEIELAVADEDALTVIITAVAMHDLETGDLVGVKWLLDPGGRRDEDDPTFDTEERLRATFEQTAVGMAHLTLASQFERVNQQFCELTGYDKDDIKDLSLQELLHTDDFKADSQFMRDLIEGRLETYTLEVRYRRKDGTLFWASQTASLMHNPQGEPQRRILVVADVTDQKTAEAQLIEALNRSEELYNVSRAIAVSDSIDAVLQAMLDSEYLGDPNRAAVLVFDRPWLDDDDPPECCDVMAEWQRQEGDLPPLLESSYLFEEYAFTRLFQRDSPTVIEDVGSDERLNEQARQLFVDSGAGTITLFPLKANAEWYGVLSLHHADYHSLEEDRLRHLSGIVDQAAVAIASRRLLEAEAQARQAAERANQAKMDFLAVVSHELRTPLSSIKGFASTLLADDVEWDEASQLDFLQTIDKEADKLGGLIRQLLDISRLEAGTLSLEKQPVTPAQILGVAAAQLETLAASHELAIANPPDLPPVEADPERIAQGLANLVSNAVRYSEPGSSIEVA
ncbi:MAG: PAS domain S-box protein, partial [Anaerolineae bacterium]